MNLTVSLLRNIIIKNRGISPDTAIILFLLGDDVMFKAAVKCLTCPYRLGEVKCIKDPCFECMDSKRKTHPFSKPKNFKNFRSEHK